VQEQLSIAYEDLFFLPRLVADKYSEAKRQWRKNAMCRLCVILFLTVAVVGCGLTPEAQQRRAAKVQACRDSGGTAYTNSIGAIRKCASPTEQARLERLEMACVESGGTVDYHYTGYYENCRRPVAKTNSGNSNSNPYFKPYCPPSKTPIYGCPPPTPVIVVD